MIFSHSLLFQPPSLRRYLSLLRVAAASADVGQAQRLLTRMLDNDVTPTSRHFHTILRCCIRSNRLLDRGCDPAKRTSDIDARLRVAHSALRSMQALRIPVVPMTVDLLLQAHTCVRRIDQALRVLDETYSSLALHPTPRAFELMLTLAERICCPTLASDLLQRMAGMHHRS
jgi:hypothetical protein